MKRIIKKIVRGQRNQKTELLSQYLSILLGDEKLCAVDVGAAHGLIEHWQDIGTCADFILIEPNDESVSALRLQYHGQKNVRILAEALSESGGERVLYITNQSTGSSLLKFNDAILGRYVDPNYIHPMRQSQIITKRLSHVLTHNNVNGVDLLKIDVQGAEYEIIKSLGEVYLNSLNCLEFEYNLHNAYLGQGEFSEIHNFLDKHGLELFDIRVARTYGLLGGRPTSADALKVFANSRSVSSRAWELDLVYFKRPQILLDINDKNGLIKLIACYAIYGFFLEILNLCESKKFSELIGAQEAARIALWAKDLHKNASARWYDKPNALTRFIRKIASICGCGPDWYRLQYSHVALPNS